MCYLGDGEHDVGGCHQGVGVSLQLVANHLGKHQADWLAQHDSFCFDPTHTCMEWQDKIMLSLFLTTSLRHNSMSLTGNEPSYNVVLVQSYISKKSNYLFSISTEFLVFLQVWSPNTCIKIPSIPHQVDWGSGISIFNQHHR